MFALLSTAERKLKDRKTAPKFFRIADIVFAILCYGAFLWVCHMLNLSLGWEF